MQQQCVFLLLAAEVVLPKKVVADKKEAVETTVAETTETETTAEKLTGVNDSEMADILAGTTWAGISSTQEIMVAAFDEKDAYLAILDTDGEVSQIWMVTGKQIPIPFICISMKTIPMIQLHLLLTGTTQKTENISS